MSRSYTREGLRRRVLLLLPLAAAVAVLLILVTPPAAQVQAQATDATLSALTVNDGTVTQP